MIRVSVEQVEEGMVLARPVLHPLRPGVVLLQVGCRLDGRAISLFPQHNVDHLWIRHTDFEDLDQRLNPGVGEMRAQLEARLKTLFTAAAAKPEGIDPANEAGLIGDLIKELSTDTQHSVTVARSVDENDDLAGHCANVAYLSTVLGLWLRDYIAEERKGIPLAAAMDLSNLVLGAAFHDIGKLAIEKPLRRAHHFEKSTDPQVYQSHADQGYRMLQGRIQATALAGILHHHQRFDGQGFPAMRSRQDPKQVTRLSERTIHVFPRIVAVANTLDALACGARRDGRPLVSALVTMQSPEFRPMFDPVVLLTAMQCVQPFPIATLVGLSDGCRAVVVEQNADSPCRPKVRVFKDGFGPDARAMDNVDLSMAGAPTISCQSVHRIDKYLYDISPELIREAATPSPGQPEPVEAGES